MSTTLSYPLHFAPCYKAYLWGGARIAARYGRRGLPAVCAESWEISTHPDGSGALLNGPLAGASLGDLSRRFRRDLLGTEAPEPDRFPLLVKLIDAQASLSLQVHPTREAARRMGTESKNESWHLLEGAPGARLYAGLAAGTTPAQFHAALAAGTVEALLVSHAAAGGDTLHIPGGLVHAIGAGCLIYEVQQSANTTYRLYDWNRVDTAGRPRPLRITEALAVIDWSLAIPSVTPAQAAADVWQTCSATVDFTLRRARLTRPQTLRPAGKSFHALFVAEGGGDLRTGPHAEPLAPGASRLIPACVEVYTFAPGASGATLLLTTL
jgi:mannose-6-phosphate isomerase